MDDHRAFARRLARQALDEGRPLEWFERLYAMATRGEAVIPWADQKPNPYLEDLLDRMGGPRGGSALCVGCGLGDDAEWLAWLGFRVTAFDISPTAIDRCRGRFPGSTVDYVVENLLSPPSEWRGTFDLVVEAYTLQVLPAPLRPEAINRVAEFLAPGGDLCLVARLRDDDEPEGELPWPLTLDELLPLLQEHRLLPVILDDVIDRDEPTVRRLLGGFHH